MISRSTIDRGPFERLAPALLLAMTVALSVLLIQALGTGDVQAFLGWGSLGQAHGLVTGYKVMVDQWPETVLGGN